jgi:hypothetical protein
MLRMILRAAALAVVVCAAAHAQTQVLVTNTTARPVPSTITNTPAVTISGTPTVTVANQPQAGQPVFDSVQVSGNTAGDVAGSPGVAVAAGKRRTVTMMSANMFCPVGKTRTRR